MSLCHFIHCVAMLRNSQEGWYGAIHVVRGRNAWDRALRQWDTFDFLPESACDTAGSKAQRKKNWALMKRNLNYDPENPGGAMLPGLPETYKTEAKEPEISSSRPLLEEGRLHTSCQAAATTATSPAGTGSHRLEVHTKQSCVLWEFCVLFYKALKKCLGSIIQATPH